MLLAQPMWPPPRPRLQTLHLKLPQMLVAGSGDSRGTVDLPVAQFPVRLQASQLTPELASPEEKQEQPARRHTPQRMTPQRQVLATLLPLLAPQ